MAFNARYNRGRGLEGMHVNNKTGRYEIIENDILYSMDIFCSMLLKKFFAGHSNKFNNTEVSVINWYNQLHKEDKAKVIRTGDLPEDKDNGFFPDKDFEA